MQEGDVLLLVTDGFHEYHRAADGVQFGIARLERTLVQIADKRPPAMLRELDQAVRTFAGDSPQLDDMTAVVIKRTAASPATDAPGTEARGKTCTA
jgi:serine phosphatase RsbU (regulator of sigma subunit)